MENVTITNEMIYKELKSIRKELAVLEHVMIPVEKLSAKELEEHKKDLEEALSEERTNFRDFHI
ncbi:MAG: hypothetical protein V1644_03060 [Candidatus Micrarchaeota archaeon]